MSESGSDTPVELYGPDDGGWYSTRCMDWIALCEDLRDADVRGYLVLRSLVIEKFKNPVRKVSLNDLCALLPGPTDGKPTSLTRVREILKNLSRVGLVSTPEGGPVKTSSRAAAGAKPIRIRINDMPADGYVGWRNTEVKLASVVQDRERREAEEKAGRKSDPAECGDHGDEGPGRKSDPAGWKSDPRGSKSDPDPAGDVPEGELPLVPTLGVPTGGEAPSARSALGARSASPAGSRGSRGGGCAASNNNPARSDDEGGAAVAAPAKSRKPGHTRAQLDQARAVCAQFPAELGVKLVPVLTDAILQALSGDVPGADRTVEQLGARIEQRWNHHGYATRFYASELVSPVGAAVAMVRPLAAGDRFGCADPRCEAGVSVDTGEECRACVQRAADRRAQHAADRQAAEPGNGAAERSVPAPRGPAPQWWECAECAAPGRGSAPTDGLCASCRAPAASESLAQAGAPF